MRKSYLFAFLGLVFGVCAPLGAIFLLWFSPHPVLRLPYFIEEEWQDHLFFFTYMLVGTSLAFAFFGYLLGRNADDLLGRNKVLSDEVLTDPLTGLGNHRFLHESFQIEFRRHLTTRAPLSCFMMDLDHFKKVNDTYGHPFGDTVLKHFADLVRKSIREGDTATRYGGEEFLCILPNCDQEEAMTVAERIRHATECFPFAHNGKKVKVTVSVGTVTGYQRAGTNYRHLIDLADQALYKAKRGGRNRVAQIFLDGRRPQPGRVKTRKSSSESV